MKLICAIVITAALLWFLGEPDNVQHITIGIAAGVGIALTVAAAIAAKLIG
jgi:hypothetical protein